MTKHSDGFFMNTQEMPSVVEKKETAKAREFFLDKISLKLFPNNLESMTAWNKRECEPHGYIHVREVLQGDELTELKRQNEIMREALEFIAPSKFSLKENTDELCWYENAAREALAKCGKGGSV